MRIGEGFSWKIHHRRWFLEVRSTWLRPHLDAGVTADRLYRVRLFADHHAHLCAQESAVQRQTEAETCSRDQLRAGCSKQQRFAVFVALAA